MDGVMMSNPETPSIDVAPAQGTGTVDPLDPEATIRLPALGDESPDLGDVLRRLTPPAPRSEERPPPRLDADPSAIIAVARSSAALAAARDALFAITSAIERLIAEGKRFAVFFLRALRRQQASRVFRARM